MTIWIWSPAQPSVPQNRMGETQGANFNVHHDVVYVFNKVSSYSQPPTLFSIGCFHWSWSPFIYFNRIKNIKKSVIQLGDKNVIWVQYKLYFLLLTKFVWPALKEQSARKSKTNLLSKGSCLLWNQKAFCSWHSMHLINSWVASLQFLFL